MKISFKINIFTYILYLIIIFSGYINYLLILLIIMFFHELGHIITIKLLGYQINNIVITPLGGIIETDINYNVKSSHLFLISISGVVFQLLLFLIIKNNYSNNYHIFYLLNRSIILLNILPIYPLDGYKIFMSFLENIISYRIANIILNIISVITLIILFVTTKNIYIFIFYYVTNIVNILNLPYIYNKFLLERLLHKKKYKKSIVVNNIKNIYKCKDNYIKYKNAIINENDYQSKRVYYY